MYRMKILFAPAKRMETPEDIFFEMTKPVYEDQARHLREILFEKSFDELLDIYKCSRKTLEPVYRDLELQKRGMYSRGPALLSYQGLAYRSMAPNVFNDEQWEYVQKHLRILSGMYGVLRPEDEISPYRLEMQTRLPFSLYEFWGDKIASALEDDVILNLASKEYSKAVAPYKKMITVRFMEEKPDGKRSEPGAYAKIARGTMVRWLAENNITDPEQVKNFSELGYTFDPAASKPDTLIFYRKNEK